MNFKKKIFCFLLLILIYKSFVFYNPNLFTEKLTDLKNEVNNQLTLLTSGYDSTNESDYDTSDIKNSHSTSKEDSNLDNKDNYTKHKIFNSISGASRYLRKQMVNRKNTISITINKKYYNNMPKDIFNRAISNYEGCSSSEGDYLSNNCNRYNCKVHYLLNEDKTILKYNIKYLTTAKEERQVNKKIKKVLDILNVYNKDEYTKIKAVHNYIVKNIKYDYDLENHSSYDAIIKKKVVCQGYATITYKMLKKLGVDCRCIRGTSNGNGHAWNIVKINNRWYNLDNTWDACYSMKPIISYKYFLKSNDDFDNHSRYKKFATNSFNNKYPMSLISYN